MSSLNLRLILVLMTVLVFSACGGGSRENVSSDTEGGSGNAPDNNNISQTSAIVMVSPNADLSNANVLESSTTQGMAHIFFQEGSDWAKRGVRKVDFYCCKNSDTPHTRYPSDDASPYQIDIDLSQYKNGTYELYVDVFFEDAYSPENYYVDFEINNSTVADGLTNNPPTISGNPAKTVTENTLYTFAPTAYDPDNDILTFSILNKPAWADFNTGTGQLTGTPPGSSSGTYSNISIRVTDGVQTASLPAFNIEVTSQAVPSYGSAKLSWVPPTLYTDNSPLSTLGGYNIYYGTSPGTYPNKISVSNPGLTSYVVGNIKTNTTYYFVITAYDANGVESDYSNTASAYIQ